MNITTSKLQILEYLQKITRGLRMNELGGFTTISISSALNISRSLTSQYLNELVKDERIIKISTRPVYYMDRSVLERKYQLELKSCEYLSLGELMKELHRNSPKLQDFQKAIGCDGSLQYPIAQLKTALSYPQGGLPVILHGEMGCGKSYLVRLTHEYCLNHMTSTRKEIPLLRKKAFRGEDKVRQMEELFGKGAADGKAAERGLLEEADEGILCIEDASHLSEECQEKLADYLSRNKFTRMQDDRAQIESRVHLILSTSEDPHTAFCHSLLLSIPVICSIPSFQERNEEERLEFVIKFFQEEQARLERTIYISKRLQHFLMSCHFESNIDELRRCIRTICTNAFADCVSNQRMDICLYHLPVQLLDHLKVEKNSRDSDSLIRIDAVEKNAAGSKILIMWEQLLQAFEETCMDTHAFTSFLEQGQKALRYYYDILVFQETYYDGRLEAMEKIVIGVLNSVKLMKNINLPINCAYVLARMLVSAQKNTSSLHQWEQDHQKEIQRCLKKMAENMSNEYILTESIARQLHSNINMRLSEMNRIFLMLNINFYNRDIRSQDTVGIILSHGYSTASSIADAANSLLNSYTFEAIDMPLNTPVQEISGKLNDFIEENPHLKNIILLVDMGSLEGIGEVIADSVNVGVINNISTSLALNIGMKIQQHYELENLLETACAENQCNYKVLSEAKKEKAIVFTNDAGMVISEKLCRLFKNSLPRPIDLKMISYEYDELMKNKAEDILFHRYDVVLMIKPYSLKLKKVNSVTLEDIMNFEHIEQLNQVFRPYLKEEEIEEFDRQLLKNFSMQSVMENITILNADKLLDYVSDSVSALQHTMGRKFQSKTIVGIYIHICFLVERLVTKTALEKYTDLSSFEKQHEDFIADVNRSFEVMLQHYHVKLPLSEIAYLFEYIENDVRKAGGEDEF